MLTLCRHEFIIPGETAALVWFMRPVASPPSFFVQQLSSLYLKIWISLSIRTLFFCLSPSPAHPLLTPHSLSCSLLVQDPVGGGGKWGHFGCTKPAVQRPHQLWRRRRRRRKPVGERREEREGLGEREGEGCEQGERTGPGPPGCGCPYPQFPSAPCVDKGGSET